MRAALLLLLLPAALTAQRSVRVSVADSNGVPVAGAEVRIAGGRQLKTDSAGRVRFVNPDTGATSFSIRRLGFEPQTVRFFVGRASDTLHVILVERLIELDGVMVSARAHPFIENFDRRRRRGVGTFITPLEIERRRASQSSDVLRQVPMVRLVRLPTGGVGIRFPGVLSIRRSTEDCIPMLWVDGQRAPSLEIDDIRADDLMAIELYRGASVVPNEFATSGRTQCGVVVIWTKRNMSGRAKPSR